MFKSFKEGQNIIQNEDRSRKFEIASTPEMVDSVNGLILFERKVTVEDISEQLKISEMGRNRLTKRLSWNVSE